MLEVYDVRYDCRFENLRFRPSTRKRKAGVSSKISTLESVFEKMRFRWPFSPDTHVDGMPNQCKTDYLFSNKN